MAKNYESSALLPEVIADVVLRELQEYAKPLSVDITGDLWHEAVAEVDSRSRRLYEHGNERWKRIIDKGQREECYKFVRHWIAAYIFNRIPVLKQEWRTDHKLQQFALGMPLS